jgi:hypothetical protein
VVSGLGWDGWAGMDGWIGGRVKREQAGGQSVTSSRVRNTRGQQCPMSPQARGFSQQAQQAAARERAWMRMDEEKKKG